ncbi:MAG: amidohydrolase/deacetylase family metallohydrolase [Vulcanimicrobiaceae bacterium]
MPVSRKDFIAANAAAGAAALIAAETPPAVAANAKSQPALAFDARDPHITYDLLVTGGDVIDPAQRLNGKRDVAIKNGQIAALLAPGTAVKTAQTIDASGRIVTPGLVDMHCHYYHQVSGIGLPADEMMHLTATTTGVDAGDAGYSTFSGFRHFVIGQARTRHFAFVHIASIGLAGDPIKVGELFNIDYADVDRCAKAVAENRDVVLGVKVRLSKNVVGNNGIEPLRRAIRAAEIAGPWARVMAHIGNCDAPLADVLEMMRPGDIITHCYSGAAGTNNIVVGGTLLPAALRAKKRGVLFDVGHGGGSFDVTIAKAAIAQGLPPDTISSDVHSVSIQSPGRPLFPNVVSKFLALGFSLDDAIAKATSEPARIIDRVPGLGTLAVGAPADLAVFRIVEGPVTFVDTNKNSFTGTRYLDPVKVVKGGRPHGLPFPDPFTYT